MISVGFPQSDNTTNREPNLEPSRLADRYWLFDLVNTPREDQSPLSKEEAQRVYSVLKTGDLSEEGVKTVVSVIGPLIEKDDFIIRLFEEGGDENLILNLLDEKLIETNGQPFLNYAALRGYRRVAARLLDSGHVDVNKASPFGQTALAFTCQATAMDAKQLEMITFLFQAGANPKIADKDGNTLLTEILLRKDYKKPESESEMLQNNLAAAELLIKSGVDVNAKNGKGDSALHLAAQFEKSEPRLAFIKLLLALKADVDARDRNGETVLEKATDEATIRTLVKLGADIYTRHKKRDNRTLLHERLIDGPDELVAAFLNISKEGAKKLRVDYNNRFYLGHYNSIQTNATDRHSYSASIAEQQCAEMTKMLEALPEPFSSHIDPNEKNRLVAAFKLASMEEMNEDMVTSSIQKGELVILPLGFKEHTMHVMFCNGYMSILNRGAGVPMSSSWLKLFSAAETVKTFKIDSTAFTKEMLKDLLALVAGDSEKAVKYYYETLPGLLSPNKDNKPVQDAVCKQIEKLRPKLQKTGNCAAAQAKLSMRVGKAMMSIKKDEKGGASLASSDVQSAYAFSKDFSSHVRLFSMDRYLANHEVDKDTADKGLLNQVYLKLKKRLTAFPESHFYPNFGKWKQKLEAEWSKKFAMARMLPDLI
ncbi:MAG TPA: ankyrin repeat domain-containing protein [Rhabdochlamydiaceae bacterium]|nr:ankyrin repeat domain-containing protein [Rhabdochlamydiaceae bacterium]